MEEPYTFYIHAYNLFIKLNQCVESIMRELNIDLSYSQYTLLKFISKQHDNATTQKQLNEWSSLRNPSISQHLRILEKKDYILHRSLNEDNRCKKITLTNKALQQIERVDKRLQDKLSKQMCKKDLQSYTQAMKTLIEINKGKE